MKNTFAVIIGVIIIGIALVAGTSITTYNSLVNRQEKVTSSYADIDTQLQRRADLIPNLINTVKGYMKHEEAMITAVTEAREKLVSANGIVEAAAANEELSAALKNMMVIVENYPDLKSSENFVQLQDELAGTENRIATARRDYNDSVRAYNSTIKRFPGRIFANMFGFEAEQYFEAGEGSSEVINVDFE